MRPPPVISIRLAASGALVCARCVDASTMRLRMRGLLGRDGLERDEGILLRPASSIHTFFMRFPIDVVFLDRDRRVLRVAPSVRPWRLVRARGTKEILELPAERAHEVGLGVGDQLVA